MFLLVSVSCVVTQPKLWCPCCCQPLYCDTTRTLVFFKAGVNLVLCDSQREREEERGAGGVCVGGGGGGGRREIKKQFCEQRLLSVNCYA